MLIVYWNPTGWCTTVCVNEAIPEPVNTALGLVRVFMTYLDKAMLYSFIVLLVVLLHKVTTVSCSLYIIVKYNLINTNR